MIQGDNVRRNKTLVTLKESKGIPRKCVAASGENTRTLKVRSREQEIRLIGGGVYNKLTWKRAASLCLLKLAPADLCVDK